MPEREVNHPSRDEKNLRRVRHDSDSLLEQMGRLKDLETRKRQLVVSTPAFHSIEDEVVNTTHDIFNTVHDEAAASKRVGHQGLTTEEVKPEG